MEELLKKMHTWMDTYMKRFVTDDEEVMQGIRIKMIHTGYVTAIARELAQELALCQHDVQLAEIMGLFHHAFNPDDVVAIEYAGARIELR